MASILVTDDEPGVRAYIRRVLERAGHTVLEAGDGQECLKRLREAEVDLLVIDLVMPDKEGIETICELSRIPSSPRIIAMSGAVPAETYLSVSRALGAVQTLSKPFTIQQIQQAVQAALEGP